ncbi:acyltransferase [Dactylosporangium sp. NPDC005572]|uniref:acyltransferase family protein n=1 Tax=Dactylosporangium sp. NPDC005572 TaxID=3156889 RepID=UPI00339EDD5B
MRNRYVDLLRAVAIIRVVTYHTLGFAWLTVAFPAMGLMFALGGSLMAASLDRSGIRSLGRRMRRILPPFMVLGAFAVVTMSLVGGLERSWRILLWFLPFDDPPANEWGAPMFGQIWYIRSYLWFILLSPVLLWVFRKWPIPSLLVPFTVLVVMWETGHGSGGIVRDFFMYAPAWMLGFAHHDGTLQKISKKVLWPACAVVGGIGLAILYSHPGPRGFDLNDQPVADMLWSTAFLLVLLNAAPRMMSLGAAEPVTEAVNRRALTIYLWHEAAIITVRDVALVLGVSLLGAWGGFIQLSSVFLLVAAVVLTIGWVEDLAARRRPQIIPAPARSRSRVLEERPAPVAA